MRTDADDTAPAAETWEKRQTLVADWYYWQIWITGGRCIADFMTEADADEILRLRDEARELADVKFQRDFNMQQWSACTTALKENMATIHRLEDEAREAQQLRRGSLQAMLIEFHAAFGLTTNLGKPPAITDESPLRRELLREEYEEYIAAEDAGDLVELADALGDMAYVIYGTAIAYGIDLDAVVREIHRSNMTKLMPDGTVKRREDGKVQKGPNFVRPNINAALEASTTTQAGET